MSEGKIFTYKEVAELDGHVIINDKVYNVSEFVNEHPGGDEIIMEFYGQDCTQDFEDIGHSPDAYKTLQKLCVGDVDTTSEKPVKQAESVEQKTSDQPEFKKIAAVLFLVAALLLYKGFTAEN
ncbi:hypothetical protein ACO0SA_001509 [Hanseniaspora valbyensis]